MLISFIAFTAKRDVKDIQVSSVNVNVFRWTDVTIHSRIAHLLRDYGPQLMA